MVRSGTGERRYSTGAHQTGLRLRYILSSIVYIFSLFSSINPGVVLCRNCFPRRREALIGDAPITMMRGCKTLCVGGAGFGRDLILDVPRPPRCIYLALKHTLTPHANKYVLGVKYPRGGTTNRKQNNAPPGASAVSSRGDPAL